jgi:hypothetical protein
MEIVEFWGKIWGNIWLFRISFRVKPSDNCQLFETPVRVTPKTEQVAVRLALSFRESQQTSPDFPQKM